MSEGCNHDCGSCGQDCASRDMHEAPNASSRIKKVIGVVSGKGGVGKSLVTGMLSVLSARNGHSTAILDADLLILASPVYVYHGHRSDDEFSGSFRNLVDDSQTFAGNEQEAGGRNFNCRRRRYEKYHKGYGGQSGNVGHL